MVAALVIDRLIQSPSTAERGSRLLRFYGLGSSPSSSAAITLDFAEGLVSSGDRGAALEQVRGALSLTARWWLLAHDVFPLARAELPAQLRRLRQPALARALEATIHGHPGPDALAAFLVHARSLTG